MINKNKDKPNSKATIELDGQEIELILQALFEQQVNMFKQEKYFKSRQLEIISQKLSLRKMEFHNKWLNYLRDREFKELKL